MIEIKNLTKIYGTKANPTVALKDVSLTVCDGDIYGIIGLSGAGKSTLVRCINGLETADEGEILYNGQKVTFDSEYRRNVAMIFQGFNLLQQRNVLKNVELAGEITKDKNRKEKAVRLLETVGLGDKLKSYPSELSGGQQQRVAIARALMTEPKVLLCDEATSALDPDTANSILQLLKELNRTLGLTVIIISHQMSVIEAVCNKVAIIENSRITAEGNLYDVFLSPKTETAKKLIYSGHVYTKDVDRPLVKLMFNGQTEEPIVSNVIRDLDVQVSILYANSKVINDRLYGQTIFSVLDYDANIAKIREYLDSYGVLYEEVNGNELE
ncbi:MAG: ATP-binding cassette domain-containing protein [Clostridia bacterium]|nr:ATP-binding cassette domain-containing protein [Clostridia bacterium]